MKSIVLFCLFAAAVAAPAATNDAAAEVLKYEYENIGTGPFRYVVEQNNNIKSEATGEFHPGTGKDNEGFVSVRGSFEWVGPDGVAYSGVYVADENGYRVQYTQGPGGVIPDEVLKSLSSPQ